MVPGQKWSGGYTLLGKEVGTWKHFPYLGTFWAGGASGATDYRTYRQSEEVAYRETRFAGPFGHSRTPEKEWVLDRGHARQGKSVRASMEGEGLLPKFDYHLDESDPDVVVLRRQDGAFVAAFSAQGATREGICEAAIEDYRAIIQAHGVSA